MSSRRSAVVLLALALTACGSSGGAVHNPPAGETAATAQADGVPDRLVDARTLVDVSGEFWTVDGLTFDAQGHAAALLDELRGNGLRLARQVDGGWTATELSDEPELYPIDLDAAGDGTLVATAVRQDSVGFLVVAPDGGVTDIVVPGLSNAADVADISPDGGTLYLATIGVHGGAARLLAVDTTNGTITAETPFDPRLRPQGLEVASSGEVVLASDVFLAEGTFTTRIARFDAALHPLTDVPLVADDGPSQIADLALDDAGTAYLVALDGAPSTSEAMVRLLAVPAGATAPTTVTSWDGYGSFVSLETRHALTVGGSTAFLLHPPDLDDLDVVVTPVDLATGEPGDDIPLAEGAEGYTVASAPDGRTLLVAGDDEIDGDKGPAVWTVG